MKKLSLLALIFCTLIFNAQENTAAQEKANKAAQEKESWLAKEKLKNITDAKTLPALATSSFIGLQIGKSSVIDRRLYDDFSDIYYMNEKFIGGNSKGVAYNIVLNSKSFKENYSTDSDWFSDRVFKTSKNEFIVKSGYIHYIKEISSNSIKAESKTNIEGQLLDITELKDGKIAFLTGLFYGKGVKNLYLTIWDQKNNKSVKYLIHPEFSSQNPQLVATKDNNLIVGFDARESDEGAKNRTTFEKINPTASFTGNELKSIWKKTYAIADAYMLTDMIEDSKGNIVCMMKSNVGKIKSDFSPEKGLEYVEYGLIKFNSKGEDFRNKVIYKLSKDKWGRSSEGGSLTMDKQEEIYFSAYENPRIIQNPNGSGYIICGRYIYGLWAYSTLTESVSTTDGRTRMFADQPALFYADENSMAITSTDFIETTYSKDYGHYYKEFSLTNQLGMNWSIRSFQYIPELKRFLILESKRQKPFESHLWLFDIDLKNNWKGEASANTEIASNTVNANKQKTSTTKSNSTATNNSSEVDFSGSVYFSYDMMGKDRPGERLYIHSGSNAAYVSSTSPGSKATVKCEKGKAYYSFTGKKADMKLIKELSVDDCGKTFKYTDFK
ncbi:MAG: hypothetical protein JNJ41_16275 [Bacteroidia bacterium]|nr:hypothetical protein [Bacteroidia bacterium]